MPELYFLIAIGATAAYGVYTHIRYKEHKGTSSDDVVKHFDNFLKHCKDKKTARVTLFLPTLKGANAFSFLCGVQISGNEELIREALKTNDFRKIIKRDYINFDYIKQGKHKFNSVPLSNWLQVNYYND